MERNYSKKDLKAMLVTSVETMIDVDLALFDSMVEHEDSEKDVISLVGAMLDMLDLLASLSTLSYEYFLFSKANRLSKIREYYLEHKES